jgi:hypothetical protein
MKKYLKEIEVEREQAHHQKIIVIIVQVRTRLNWLSNKSKERKNRKKRK